MVASVQPLSLANLDKPQPMPKCTLWCSTSHRWHGSRRLLEVWEMPWSGIRARTNCVIHVMRVTDSSSRSSWSTPPALLQTERVRNSCKIGSSQVQDLLSLKQTTLVGWKECGRTSPVKPRILFTFILYCLVSILAIDGLLLWLLKETDF